MNLENTVLLTHKHCMDGSGCGIVFQAAGGKYKNIIFAHPPESESMQNAVDKILKKKPESLIIADISVTNEQARDLNKAFNDNNILLFDHHKTALHLAGAYSWCNVDRENLACGTYMLYNYFVKNRYYKDSKPEILKYKDLVSRIDDHDRWQHNFSNSRELASLHYFVGQKNFMKRFIKNSDLNFTEAESYILKILKDKNKEYIENKISEIAIYDKEYNGKGYRVGIVQANDMQSELGNKACLDMQLNIDFLVMIGNQKVSMRSNDLSDIDVSKIAKQYGGGGHKNAAGFLIDNIVNFNVVETFAKNFLK